MPRLIISAFIGKAAQIKNAKRVDKSHKQVGPLVGKVCNYQSRNHTGEENVVMAHDDCGKIKVIW